MKSRIRLLCPRLVLALLLSAVAALPLPAQRAAVEAEHGMVASAHALASEAGAEILRKGGNAVDAAVATGFALTATFPSAGNLAGGGFMLIHLAEGNRQVVIDYRETAPAVATRDMFLNPDGSVMTDLGSTLLGWRASGVPGTVAGLAEAFQKYGSGKVTWAEVIEPARRLAEAHVVTEGVAASLREFTFRLGRFEESKRIFLNGGAGWKAGDTWRQPELAATLVRLQREGPREFYEGLTGRLIAEAMQANAGTITREDLKGYRIQVREVLRQSYRGHEVVVPPPPSSGGLTLLQMLAMIEPFDLKALGQDSAAKYHLFAEAARRAFIDRIEYIGDPAFVNVPVARLLDRAYLARRMADFNPRQATPSAVIKPGLGLPHESNDTTCYAVVDAQGNAVSNSYTLRNSYGSGVTIPGTGLLMNNVMDNMATKVGQPNMFGLVIGEVNIISPGRRAASSQTPVMVFKDGRLLLVTSSPGGPTIINTVLQVITNVVDFGMPVMQAVEAPRIHHQWLPDKIEYERYGLSADTLNALQAMGHTVAVRPTYQGDAETILVDPKTGRRLGASDPRQPDATSVGH
ncbi:MAG: gamma-glutamyltransferase [Opitutaceae bacterium]|nr:gamma-glutamyltransferase [Opitutaceae bacterium]